MIPNARTRGRHRQRARTGLPWGCDPLTADVTYEPAEVEFMVAMERFQRLYHCRQPTCADILAVIRELGYRQVADPSPSDAS